jgi:hypothetical protein
MLTDLGVQGTTTKNHWDDLSSAVYSAKYVSDTGGSGICINGDGLLDVNLVCDDSYRLANAYNWHEPKITLDEEVVKQIADDVAKNLIKQKDPLEKNSNVDEVEVPPMSGFIEI